MMTQSFEELVASMAAKTPTPGGGAAAAMAGCMGTSLFLMTVRFSQGKKANVDREGDLSAAESALSDHLEQLRPMAERDCAAFDLVSAAFRMPKESDEQKVALEVAVAALRDAGFDPATQPGRTGVFVSSSSLYHPTADLDAMRMEQPDVYFGAHVRMLRSQDAQS